MAETEINATITMYSVMPCPLAHLLTDLLTDLLTELLRELRGELQGELQGELRGGDISNSGCMEEQSNHYRGAGAQPQSAIETSPIDRPSAAPIP